jgi:hypothetical protein
MNRAELRLHCERALAKRAGAASLSDFDKRIVAEHSLMLKVLDLEARVEHLQELVDMLKEKLREPMAELFECHPEGLGGS